LASSKEGEAVIVETETTGSVAPVEGESDRGEGGVEAVAPAAGTAVAAIEADRPSAVFFSSTGRGRPRHGDGGAKSPDDDGDNPDRLDSGDDDEIDPSDADVDNVEIGAAVSDNESLDGSDMSGGLIFVNDTIRRVDNDGEL